MRFERRLVVINSSYDKPPSGLNTKPETACTREKIHGKRLRMF